MRALVALGQVVIPCNKNHTCIDPEGIGKALRTKINVNLGTSRDVTDYDSEIEKVNWAIQLGAESIMDLSTHGDTRIFRRKLTSECKAMIGTVPVYDSVIHHQRDLVELTAEDFLDTIRLHAEDGVDFVTLHCGITRQTIEQIKKHKRRLNIVSRGGSLIFAWKMCIRDRCRCRRTARPINRLWPVKSLELCYTPPRRAARQFVSMCSYRC